MRKKRIGDFAALLLHIRELNGTAATHGHRLTKLEESPEASPIDKQLDTGELSKRRFLPVVIAEKFNLSDLRMMAYGLDLDFENLVGETVEDKALSLVLVMQRNGRFSELLKALAGQRPKVDWSKFR